MLAGGDDAHMRGTTATTATGCGRRTVRTGFLAVALLLACGLSGALSAATGATGAMAAPAGAGGPASIDARYFERNWRRGDGLPGNSVYAIAQAADGYLWIGTENGLARLDGQQFVAVGALSPSVFRSRLVGALAAGRDGTLWIGTERGLLRMRGGVVAPEGPPGGLASDAAVSALAEDGGGDLWIGTRLGLLRRSAASGKVTRVGLAGTRVVQLLPGDPGVGWNG